MILVIGGAGYIGSHMVNRLQGLGREVVVLDNLSTGYRQLVDCEQFVQGDLGDVRIVRSLLSKYPISVVMHFAANSLVGESVKKPLEYYANNVSQTISLLQQLISHGISQFIFSSSAAVYGSPGQTPISENHVVAPTNPYGNTKLTVERILEDCSFAYDFRYVSLRYFNAAGADQASRRGECHDPESHLIPLAIKAALGVGPKLTVFGSDYPTPDGTCVRDYIHVEDLACGHELAMDHLLKGGTSRVFNLGNRTGYSVLEVIQAVEQVTGQRVPYELGDKRAGDPATLVADSSAIKQDLGWKPTLYSLEEIIHSAWKWELNSENIIGSDSPP